MSTQRSVIVVGNFDGVHQGHQALFRAARKMADAQDARVQAVTFYPHPLTVLRPNDAPPRLMHPPQRDAALHAAGADHIESLEPTRELLDTSPEQFIDMLCQRFDPVGMVEGQSFRFGRRRSGTPQRLADIADARGFDLNIHDVVNVGLTDNLLVPISSSLVRYLVAHGRVADATIALGRPYTLCGTVAKGDGRGRQIGFPTLNLDVGDQLLPADGVYAGIVTRDNETHVAAVSVGRKPTFGHSTRTAEAHLLDFDDDLYGQPIQLTLDRWIRPQMPFGSVGRLTRQLQQDIATIRTCVDHDLLTPHAVRAAQPAA